MKRKGKAYIGTSGWHYDHWLGTFYPADLRKNRMLEFYIERFKTVELNNSFYHLPKRETFEQWRESTPADFLFAVKASRYITHMKKLKEPKKILKNFLDAAEGLGKKLGPILFQLPPAWNRNPERLEEFLDAFPKKLRCTFEFRNESWFADEILRILERHGAAFCIYKLKGLTSPLAVTADFVYVRMHGPGDEAYQGLYDKKELSEWAAQVKKWQGQGRDVFMYFDNDQEGYAARNATEIRSMVEG